MRFEFTEKIDTFSLNNVQLYVGMLRNTNGEMAKGVSLLFASYSHESGPVGTYDYVFSDVDARRMLVFLGKVLTHNLPATFTFPASTKPTIFFDDRFQWSVRRFKEKWHHGGGFAGRIEDVTGCVITNRSAERLQRCIRDLFRISV